jgi:nucleoid-associated protein YgaU
MRHVVKYLLVLAVLMSGFYMARMFRVPQSVDIGVEGPAEGGATEVPALGEDDGARAVSDAIPVAALADVDKKPVVAVDELSSFGSREPADRMGADTGQRTLSGQPAVRKPAVAKRQRPKSDEASAKNTWHNSSERLPETDESDDSYATDEDSLGDPTGDFQNWTESESESTSHDGSSGTVEQHSLPQGRRRSVTYDNAVPDFAADYKPWLEPLEESAQPDSNQVESYEESDSSDKRSSGQAGTEGIPTTRHRIVEGDTLQRLAEQYLGDRERYLDLYKANSDVLIHPRLLPIGIEIVIPGQSNTLAMDEHEDSDDLAAQTDPWEGTDETQADSEPAYSPWGDY